MKLKEKTNPKKFKDMELVEDVLVSHGLITEKQKNDKQKLRKEAKK